ncbi:MAG: PorV/PorQ family protein [Elusimicrobiota bacterium]
MILPIFVLCILINPVLLFATGETAGRVLQLPVGARQISLGEAFSSVADDINTLHYNPAGLNELNAPELSFMYNRGLSDLNTGLVAYGRKLNKSAVGASLLYFDGGEIELNYSDAPSVKKKAQQDLLLTLSWARQRLWFLGKFGLNLKVFYSSFIEEVKASAWAVDFGFLFKVLPNGKYPLSTAVVFQNIGPKVTYTGGLSSGKTAEWLPWTAKVGLSTKIKVKQNNTLTPSYDITYSHFEGSLYKSAGLEYSVADKFYYRAGWRGKYALQSAFCLGFGMLHNQYRYDYALAYQGTLGLTHYLSFTMRM